MQSRPKAVKLVRRLVGHVADESVNTEAQFDMLQVVEHLAIGPGPLRQKKGALGVAMKLQVFLLDNAVLMATAKRTDEGIVLESYLQPLPLDLLVVSSTSLARPTSTSWPKSIPSRISNVNATDQRAKEEQRNIPKPTSKLGFPIHFSFLGRKGFQLTLWSPSYDLQQEWLSKIMGRREDLLKENMVFEPSVLVGSSLLGPLRVNCAAPYDRGARMVIGTDDAVYMVNLLAPEDAPVKVLSCKYVAQVEILEDAGILVVLADKTTQAYDLESLSAKTAVETPMRTQRLSTNASFMSVGTCLGRTLVCIVKSSVVSSTIKVLEPLPCHKLSSQGPANTGQASTHDKIMLRIFKEFRISECTSVSFLKTKLCIGQATGFEIVDLQTLDTQLLLNPADSSLKFVQESESARPLAIYRIDEVYLLCYNDFAFYVNKNGWRARSNWLVRWEGSPRSFALHYPYVLAFDATFVEARHVDSGALVQIIPGTSLRLLFADSRPPPSKAVAENNPNVSPGPGKHVVYSSDDCIWNLREIV